MTLRANFRLVVSHSIHEVSPANTDYTPTVCERDEEQEDVDEAWEDMDNDNSGEDANNAGVELLLTSPSMRPSSNENATQVTLENDRAPTQNPPATEGYEIEYFPGKEAAAPITMPVTCESTFTIYQQQLNDDNMYAPFASKLDWKVAEWAKLRGPSSSAFNELLQIDGVSKSNHHYQISD